MHNNHSIFMEIVILHREIFRMDSEEGMMESECLGGIWYESLQSLVSGDFIFLRGNYVSCKILSGRFVMAYGESWFEVDGTPLIDPMLLKGYK